MTGARQPAVPFLGVREGHGIGPFLGKCLYVALGVDVVFGCVGPGADVPQHQGAVSLGERLGDVGGFVVAHHTPALDPLAVEPGDRTAEKDDHRCCCSPASTST